MALTRGDGDPGRVRTIPEVTTVGMVPARPARLPSREWECGKIRESRFGGSYRKCGYSKEDR